MDKEFYGIGEEFYDVVCDIHPTDVKLTKDQVRAIHHRLIDSMPLSKPTRWKAIYIEKVFRRMKYKLAKKMQ